MFFSLFALFSGRPNPLSYDEVVRVIIPGICVIYSCYKGIIIQYKRIIIDNKRIIIYYKQDYS